MKHLLSRLHVTKDYRLFDPSPHNRDIGKIKQLEESMRKYGFDEGFPIRCRPGNGARLIVTHGHHRLHVAESLGLPVWFIVAKHDIPMFESETANHAWNIRDYVVARARACEKPAEEILRYHKETGIGLRQCIAVLGGEAAGSDNKSVQVKMGKYKVKPNRQADDLARIVLHLKEIGCKFSTNNYFVSAISKCLQVDQFDADVFMHKCRTHLEIMEQRRNVDDFLDLIELVYNRQTPRKYMTQIAFLAKREAMQRKGKFGKK